MLGLDRLEALFVAWSFLFQIILIVHFALRKWAFKRYAWKFGWIVYALSIPALIVSLVLYIGGKSWEYWMAGLLYILWALYGYWIDYMQQVRWRNPINWRVGGPYVTLYLATIMFYWWPLGLLNRTLWYAYAVLFVISTWFNLTSHHSAEVVEQILTAGKPEGADEKP